MSLHNAAKHIAAHGRGEDTVLVHMTPNEVSGLQAVAKAHGGSLTINPHTGLAEAGFLKGLLPTLLGAGLAATGVGAPMAALMVGGGYTVASGGDLKKGLMAGLGAYGGAGMYGAVNPAAVPTAGASPAVGGSVASTPLTTPTPVPTPTPLAEVANVTPTSGPMSGISPETGFGPNGYVGNTITPAPPAVGSPEQLAQQSMAPSMPRTTIPTTPSYTPAAKSFEDAAFSKYGAASLGSTVAGSKEEPKAPTPADPGMIRPYTFERTRNEDAFKNTTSGAPLSSREQRYFNDTYTAQTPYKAPGPEYMAAGGPVEDMSNNAMMGVNTMYPMANISTSSYGTPDQMASGGTVDAMSGEPNMQGTRLATGGEIEFRGHFNANANQGGGQGNGDSGYQSAGGGGDSSGILGKFQGQTGQPPASYAPPNITQAQPTPLSYAGQAGNAIVDAWSQLHGGFAAGGQVPSYGLGGALGGYSDGGRMLKGPGDGMSDNIPATIGGKQPARLADGEFVVPADVVSHLGNGSTDAGAKQLYAMMDKIRAARTGTKKQGKQINPRKYMPA
jgi:hypothetical protein